ncbi:MAG: Tol-Pal system beta propeller repeat protein TolB [Alphaproteobacteria bacterium]|nr:Tol-Pal system beta propeller repeat protein TolB [Alphaproteobacteria bacterium]
MKTVIIFLVCLIATTAEALKIEITKGEVRPDPIAIVNFYSEDSEARGIGSDIAEVVGNDLVNSGLFELTPEGSYIQKEESVVKDGPRFADWRLLGSRFLLTGKITEEWGGKITVDFMLFDVIAGQKLIALSMSSDKKKWRKIAHMIADAVYSRVTNETGYFNTHIVYVETVSKGKNSKKRIMRMDQDGENSEALTDSSRLVLTPRYSPDGQKIAYLSYMKNSAHVYLLDLHTKKKETLGNLGEMNFAPRFSPDSKTVVMSLVKGGKSAIYKLELASRKLTQLTQHRSIDTSPCFSPDGTHIVFTSDRDAECKGEQLYIMDINGGNLRRISFDKGKYSQPVWSPRKDLIAFTKQIGGQFYIGVISPEGTGERLIAEGYLVEGADWAPNGRYLIYTKEHATSGQSQVYKVDLTGRHTQQVKTKKDASDCTWSPLLK